MTSAGASVPGGRLAHAPTAGLSSVAVVYLAAVALLAGASAAALLPRLADLAPGRSLVIFAVLGTCAMLAQLRVVPTGRNHGYHTAIVFAVAAALLLPPELLVLFGLAQHGLEGVRKRYAWYIQTFNVSSCTIQVLSAWAAAQLVLEHAPLGAAAGAAVAGLAASLALVLVNRVLLAGMLALARGHTFRSSRLFAPAGLILDLVVAGLGLALASFLTDNLWLVPAVLAPLVLSHRSFSFLAALRESEERFRAMFESAPVGAALVGLDGAIVACNPAFARMLGHEREQLVGKPVDTLSHPEDTEPARALFTELVAGERDQYDVERRYVASHGSIVWAHEAVALARRMDGKPRFAIATVEDVSERRALEEELRQAQKLEAIGRLAGGVAHDFNNLLTAISGYGNFALTDLDNGRAVDRADLEEITRAADRAAKLTAQLLAFGRKQVLQPRVVSLDDVVGEMDKLLRRLIGEHIRFVTAFGTDVGHVRADPAQLEQVIVNLAVNARDAMRDGGELRIETAKAVIAGDGDGGADVPPGRYALLTVSDTGCGMDEETQARVFDPFFTTKGPGEGTGLGLATVHGVIGQSGGHIRLDSAPGSGTRYRIYLPHVEEDVAAEESRPARGRSAGGSETVLVVEDETVVRGLIRDALAASGYRVIEARDGLEALEMCEGAPDRIDIVVTDVVMPRLNGAELVERLAPTHAEARVLYVSGYADGAIGGAAALAPTADFLQKPFTPRALVEKVRDVLDGVGQGVAA